MRENCMATPLQATRIAPAGRRTVRKVFAIVVNLKSRSIIALSL
jgi:hypothetical protein